MIDQVIQEVMGEIIQKNQTGQAFGAESGYGDMLVEYDEPAPAQNNMVDAEGQLIGDANAVKTLMTEFKQQWKENLKRHCEEAASVAQQRQHQGLTNYARYQ